MCPPFVSLLVSALVSAVRCPRSISIHLSPRSATGGVRPFPLATLHLYSFVSQICQCWCPPFSAGHVAFLCICLPGLSCHCWCPPFSAGHVAFLFVCLQGLSLLVSALFRCHVAFLFICLRGLSLLESALFRWPCSISMHLSPSCHCWCPPFSAGHVAFLFICLPGLPVLVSALFRWPCSISMHLSPGSVTAGVRPLPLAM